MDAVTFETLPAFLSADDWRTPRTRALLLRAEVELFVARENHPPRAVATFAALAAPLARDVDEETAVEVARRVVAHPDCPPELVAALAARADSARLVVLEMAPSLDEAEIAAALMGSAAEARALSRRPTLPDFAVETLAIRPEAAIRFNLAGNAGFRLPPDLLARLVAEGRADRLIARALLDNRLLEPTDRAVLFMTATSSERAAILDGVASVARLDPARRVDLAEAGALDRAALSGRRADLAAALAEVAGLAPEMVDEVLEDRDGEPLVVLGHAFGLEETALVRAMLTMLPHLGHSVARVHGLVALHRRLDRAVSRRVVRAFTGVEPVETGGRHRPLADQAERRADRDARGRRREPEHRNRAAKLAER